MRIKITLITLLIIPILLIPKPVSADGIIIPEPPICDPSPCHPIPIPISQLEIRYHHVNVTIENQLAVTHVDQVFYNPNDWVIEGMYVFPIPVGAAINEFTMWIDGEPVKGKVLDSNEARLIYENIVRERQDPALLEYISQDSVQIEIFPIQPGGESRIELEYSEVLEAENGLIRYLYPLNTEKFSTQPLNDVYVNVNLTSDAPIRAAFSPSHSVDVNTDDMYHMTASYESTNVKPSSDFIFYYSIGENEAFHLMSFRDSGDGMDSDGFFTLLLAPNPVARSSPISKDIIIVLDRSGSMEGEKFAQAQSALNYILRHLNQEDRFNLIAFSDSIKTFSSSMNDLSSNEEAVSWVNRLSATGSTDINRALLEAITLHDKERTTYLIFLTDGLPTAGVTENDEILENFEIFAPENLKLFVFGVGYDVDTYLLDSLSKNHHGTSTYVKPEENIDEILSGFYTRISSPVLTDLELMFDGVDVYDLYPNLLPDLFQGSQIIVVGRYRDGGKVDVTLNGNIGNHVQSFVFTDETLMKDTNDRNNNDPVLHFIPRLWATRKIGYLLNEIRLHGPNQEILDQIVRLSIRYGIVTPYTSYLVTEPDTFGITAQNQIVEKQLEALESAPAEPSYGRLAVEKSAAQGEMENTDVISPQIVESENVVQIVGSRTFVLSDDVWIDTTFDPETMVTIKVKFLSEDYFALTEAYPGLAASFALGQRVIAVSGGSSYEVVSSGIPEDQRITLPDSDLQTSNTNQTGEGGQITDTRSLFPDDKDSVDDDTNILVQSNGNNNSTGQLSCLGGLLPLLFIPFVCVVILKRYSIS